MRLGALRHLLTAGLMLAACGSDTSGTRDTDAGGEGPSSDQDSGASQPGDEGAAEDAAEGDDDAPALDDASQDDGTGLDDGADVGDDDGDTDPGAAKIAPGPYAMRQRSATTATALGMTVKSVITGYSLVDIEQRDGALFWRQRGCRTIAVNDPASNELTIADAVSRTTPATEGPLLVQGEGTSLSWERPEVTVAVGFHDDDPSKPVPQDDKDARVFDQDMDGHPGVTSHVKTGGLFALEGDTYSVQRAHSKLSGSVEGKRLVGEGFDRNEPKIIGASDKVLTAVELTPERDPKGDNSVLVVPLTSALDCDQLVSQLGPLFGE